MSSANEANLIDLMVKESDMNEDNENLSGLVSRVVISGPCDPNDFVAPKKKWIANYLRLGNFFLQTAFKSKTEKRFSKKKNSQIHQRDKELYVVFLFFVYLNK